MASDDYRKAYAPPVEVREPSGDEADAPEDLEDEVDQEEDEVDDEDDEEEDEPPPPPPPDPILAGTRLAGVLLGIDAGAAASVWALSQALDMSLRWIFWVQPIAVGALAAIVLTLQRELRSVVLFIATSLALYSVFSMPNPAAMVAFREVGLSPYAGVALIAAARVLPLVRLLFGRPSQNQRRLSALIMGAAIVALYGGLAQLFLMFA